VHSNGFDEFMLRRHSWQPDETAADQVVAVAAYKAATNELLSVIAPEDRFVALTDEMGALRRERNHYRDGIHELASVAYADDDADRVLSMAPAEKVRHVVGTLTDMGRQWLMAAKQAAQSVTESGPPATPQTTSDFVRGGTLASRQFATLDLQSLQSLLSAIPSYLVVDAVKSCIREWLYRIMREGERVYTVYTMEDLHELNAFLCSPLVGGLGMDLSTTIGKSVEGHQVQHASDSACRHPSFKTSSQIPGRFPHTVRPGNDGFSLDDVAAGLKRST